MLLIFYLWSKYSKYPSYLWLIFIQLKAFFCVVCCTHLVELQIYLLYIYNQQSMCWERYINLDFYGGNWCIYIVLVYGSFTFWEYTCTCIMLWAIATFLIIWIFWLVQGTCTMKWCLIFLYHYKSLNVYVSNTRLYCHLSLKKTISLLEIFPSKSSTSF